MQKLKEYGFTNLFGSFDSYYKDINTFQICVSKYISDSTYKVYIIQYSECGNFSDEILINENATLEWIIKLNDLLLNTK